MCSEKANGQLQGKFFTNYSLEIGQGEETPFLRKFDVFQDGTTPMYRDADGTLWAMSGHSHMGNIAVFSGTCLDDMAKRWDIKTNFCVGHCEYAFNGIRYPEGILPRGSIWPFGLYICPNTHRFFCWFHNETGWNGKGTSYDAFGLCNTPKFDSDFRHIGLMHSDDEGQNWTFDRWTLAGNEAAFTNLYNPGAGNAIGQDVAQLIRLGSGDFSVFISPEDDYIYLFYDIITQDLHESTIADVWKRCDVHVARCRKRTDGLMGDFVKYYDGSFCESGIFGRESVVLENAWHPRVVYSVPEKMYIMTSKPILSCKKHAQDAKELDNMVQISVSTDLVHWSAPEIVYQNGKPWGNHYNAIVSDDAAGQPSILTKNTFSLLTNHNATDVLRYRTTLTRNSSGV